MITVSVDSPEATARLRAELGLEFTMLCDPERALLRAWSLLNPRERGGIAFPATFVLGRGGAIVFRSLDRLTTRVDPGPVLEFLARWVDDPGLRDENDARALQRPGAKDASLALVRKWFGRR